MSEHNLLLESRVLFVGANIVAASLLAGLTGLALRRCLARRSLPLQHGVLTATLAVLLLAPLCLAITAHVPGIGFEWHFDNRDTTGPAAVADTPEPDQIVHEVADNGDLLAADLSIDAPAVPTWSNDDNIPFDSTGEDIDWILAGEPPALPPLPEPDPVPADSPEAIAASLPATAPLVAAENDPVRQSDDPPTAVMNWNLRSLASILLLVWCAGIAVGLTRCVSGFLLVARLRRKSRSPNLPALESLAASVCADLGLRRPPRILLTDRVDVPLTLGLRRPVILLPADLVENASQPRLRAILLHEAAHVVRRDLWVGVLQRLAAALYWWNPLVHRVNRQLNDVRESLCDNHVLLAGEDVRDYADALLTLAARIARPARAATALGLVGRPCPGLSGRITHLLKQDRDMSTRLTVGTRRIIVVTTLGIICGLSLAAVRAPGEESTTQPEAAATTPAADPFAESDATVRFSEVREHVLSMGSLNFLLDLDTDQTMDPPATGRPGQEKMDVHPAQEQPDDRPTGLLCSQSPFLVGSPLRGVQVTPEDWNASVSDLQDALASDEVQSLAEMKYESDGPATYFFRTSDGTDGILQLTAIIKGSPPFVGRDTQGIRVRYKVLEPVAEAAVPQADGPAAPPDRLLTTGHDPAPESSEGQSDTEMLAPQAPIANSGVVPLLMASRQRSHNESGSQSYEYKESVDWKSFISVRALFDKLGNVRWLASQMGRPRSEIELEFQLIDFELERQTRAVADEKWSDWEEVDVLTAREVVTESAGLDPDVAPVGATNAVITMPLPMRALGVWDYRQVSHPVLQDRQPSTDEIARQVAVCRQLLKDFMERREPVRTTPGIEKAGFSDMTFDVRDLLPDGQADDIALNLDFNEFLFRYLDFDISAGTGYRYRVRVKFGTDRENSHWTGWSEPTGMVTAASADATVQRYRESINRSIVRIETDVDGTVRAGSGVVISAGQVAREHRMQSVLTSAHLLKDFEAARDTLKLQLFAEQHLEPRTPDYVSVDEDAGLALLCFSNLEQELPTARLGSLQRLPQVDDAVTFHWWIGGGLPEFSEHRVVAVDRYGGPSNLECNGLLQAGQPSGGLFNDRAELIGIAVATELDEQRSVFTSLPAILEFLDIDETSDGAPAGNPYGVPVTGTPIGFPDPAQLPVSRPGPGELNPATVPDPPPVPPKEIQVGMTFDEVIAIRGKHYRPTPGMGVGQLFLVYDDVTVGIQGSMRENEAGRVFRIDPTASDIDDWIGNIPYADAAAQDPQSSSPNPGETPQQAAPPPGRNGADEKDVILIALDADDDGELAEVHFLSDSLGSGDDAFEQLSRRMGAAAQTATEANRKLQVQISVDPQLKYASVARIMEICRERGADDVRLSAREPDNEFEISIGFVRDSEGRKLSETPVVFWGDQLHRTQDLASILEAERKRRPDDDASIMIRADNDVPAEVIQDVLRQAEKAGFALRYRSRPRPVDAERKILQGTVLDVTEEERGEIVRISIGSDDGLRPQNMFDVYRDDEDAYRGRKYVARIEVYQVEADHGVASVILSQNDVSIAVGDHVEGPLRTDVPHPRMQSFGTLHEQEQRSPAFTPSRTPSRIVANADEDSGPVIQVQFQKPRGMNLHLPDPFPGTTDIVTAPFRLNVTPGELALKLANIPGREGLELRTTIDVAAPNAVTDQFLNHNAVAIQFTDEDFSQAESGNFVVKVIYLPHPQEDEADGVGTLVSTHLDPSLDPVKEAERRGTVLAVVRLGNRTEGSED